MHNIPIFEQYLLIMCNLNFFDVLKFNAFYIKNDNFSFISQANKFFIESFFVCFFVCKKIVAKKLINN